MEQMSENLKTKLWDIANTLRGKMDADDFRNYILVFVYYFLQQFRFVKYVIGSTIPHIYFKDYSTAKLMVPKPEEQQKIADFLSSLDKKITGVNAQIDKTPQFKKRLLQEMFV
ncbi:MAG: type I restriction enzyme S subunit [Polaribacter sp.]|jgi:type I restriction enzyme S subunit